MENNIKREEDMIDLLEIGRYLLSQLWKIIICFVIGGVLAGGYTHFFITPQYSAQATIYVLTKTTTVTSMADLQLSSSLTTDFQRLIMTRPSLETVIENLGLDYTYGEMTGKVTVNNPQGTRFLEITVTDPEPKLARDIANETAAVAMDRIAYTMNTDKPKIVENAIIPAGASSPNLTKNAMYGAIFGAALMIIWLLLKFVADDTVKTEEDVRKYLDLNVLATLPVNRGVRKRRREAQ